MKFGPFIGALVFGFGLGVGGFYSFVTPTPTALAQTLTPEQRATLQAEYDQLQTEIAQWQKVLDETKAKKNTLTGDVTALNAQIAKAQKEIKQRSITISTLGSEITQKTATIKTLEQRLEAGQEALAKLMRQKNEAEQRPLAILALSADDLSSFFSDVQNIDTIDAELQNLFATLRGVKTETQKEKEALNDRKNAELDARHEVVVKQTQIKENQTEKQKLLDITKKEEGAYQQVLAERQRKAAEIYARLFPLRDTEAIKFGDAVAYANTAALKTGVRPVLILAILSQESGLGTNVGNCFVTNLSTGSGKGKKTGTPIAGVMKAPRDTVPFERITKALGKDWSSTPVSCPQSSGYGGAMGPTQFIPSTWELFAPRIERALGVPATNPWNAEHAIMATGLYLSDAGAGAQTYTAERNAACKYFSGSKCPASGWIANYANSVIAKANAYEKDIAALADL